MSEIEPGEGWRLLGPQEVIKKGDEVCPLFSFIWSEVPEQFIGKENQGSQIRRRIPAKPEAMEIDHQTIKCNSFDEVMAKDDSGSWRVVSNTEQARQLADWLTRFADWREAQESK